MRQVFRTHSLALLMVAICWPPAQAKPASGPHDPSTARPTAHLMLDGPLVHTLGVSRAQLDAEPAANRLALNLTKLSQQAVTVEVWDAQGALRVSFSFPALEGPTCQATYHTQGWPEGTYTVKLISPQGAVAHPLAWGYAQRTKP